MRMRKLKNALPQIGTYDELIRWQELTDYMNYLTLSTTNGKSGGYISTPTKNKERYDVDVFTPIGKKDYIVELKTRIDYGIDDFDDLRVGKRKIDAIRKIADDSDRIAFLVCFYPKDDKAVVWKLGDGFESKYLYSTKTTAQSRYTKEWQETYSLPISEGKVFDHKYQDCGVLKYYD